MMPAPKILDTSTEGISAEVKEKEKAFFEENPGILEFVRPIISGEFPISIMLTLEYTPNWVVCKKFKDAIARVPYQFDGDPLSTPSCYAYVVDENWKVVREPNVSHSFFNLAGEAE